MHFHSSSRSLFPPIHTTLFGKPICLTDRLCACGCHKRISFVRTNILAAPSVSYDSLWFNIQTTQACRASLTCIRIYIYIYGSLHWICVFLYCLFVFVHLRERTHLTFHRNIDQINPFDRTTPWFCPNALFPKRLLLFQFSCCFIVSYMSLLESFVCRQARTL